MVFSEVCGEPVMTDEERLAAIANQYAVLRNGVSGMKLSTYYYSYTKWHVSKFQLFFLVSLLCHDFAFKFVQHILVSL